MDARAAHIDAVTTLGEQIGKQLMAGQTTGPVALAALLLLARAMIEEVPADAPLSMQIFKMLLPHLLHDLEPDAAPSADVCGPVH